MTEAREIATNIKSQLDAAGTRVGADLIARTYCHDQGTTVMANVAEELLELVQHSGWPNQETWCVNLWLNNDAGHYEACRAMVMRCKSVQHWQHEASHLLKSYVDGLCDITSDALATAKSDRMGADLMRIACQRVDWRAIASAFGEE